MYLCTYGHMYMCMYACMYVCMYVCIYIYLLCEFSIFLQLFVYPMDVQMEDTAYALVIAPVQQAGREQDAKTVK